MKHCKNCHSSYKKNYENNHKDIKSSQQIVAIHNQYGLPKMVASSKVIYGDDEYLLQILSKTHKKTIRLERSVSKMKKQIRHLQKSLEHMKNHQKIQNKKLNCKIVHKAEYDLGFEQAQKYERSSLNSSKSREIGKFTRVTERQSRSSSKSSQRSFNPPIIPICDKRKNYKEVAAPALQDPTINKTNKNEKQCTHQRLNENKVQKQVILEAKNKKNAFHEQNFKSEGIEMYLPSYQQIHSNNSSNLLCNDEDEMAEQKNRMKRQFQELIIMEKNANEQQRGIIREEINALSQMLGIISG